MKLGIMQPYFIPYIGYWQLMNAVDKYVIYDDVSFIKGGWINRNRILVNGMPKLFNIQMIGASSNKLINDIGVNNKPTVIEKNLRIIEGAYRKAPYFDDIFPLMQKILYCSNENLAEYLTESIYIIADFLDMKTELIISSKLKKNSSLKSQDKVIDICKTLNATEYYNAMGGQELYSYQCFNKEGIILRFLKTNEIMYNQFSNKFVTNLSILDVLMFNSKEQVKKYLKEYTIIDKQGERL